MATWEQWGNDGVYFIIMALRCLQLTMIIVSLRCGLPSFSLEKNLSDPLKGVLMCHISELRWSMLMMTFVSLKDNSTHVWEIESEILFVKEET